MCQHLVAIGNSGKQIAGGKKQPSALSLGLFNESCEGPGSWLPLFIKDQWCVDSRGEQSEIHL